MVASSDEEILEQISAVARKAARHASNPLEMIAGFIAGSTLVASAFNLSKDTFYGAVQDAIGVCMHKWHEWDMEACEEIKESARRRQEKGKHQQ